MSGGSRGGGPLLVVLSGPSGVGKDAVLIELRRTHPELFISVTATTRPQRPGEVDGLDYIFLTVDRFESLLERGEFLEHAVVYGRRYGSPKAPLRDALADGHDALVKVDVQGAASIRRLAPDALLVFLIAPSMEELERRLISRKTESPEQMKLRIQTARGELAQAESFDFVIVNETDAVAETVERIVEVIGSERLRVPPRRVVL